MTLPDPALDLRLASVLDHMSDAFFVLDGEWRFVYLNAQTEPILERRREELLGKNIWEALPEAVGSTFYERCHAAVAGGETATFEEFYAPLRRWLQARAHPTPSGLLVFIHDVSERVAADAAVRASEEKFARAFAASPLILTITRLTDGRFVEVNDSFVATSGWTRAEALGRTPVELGLWAAPSQRDQGVARLRAGAPIRNLEARFRAKSGEERFGLLAADVIMLQGEPCALTAIVDTTERKQAEVALARYRLLSEHTRDIVLFIHPDGRIAEANLAAELAYGYDAAALRTLTVYDLRAAETLPQVAEQLAEADAGGVRFETIHRRRDGSTFPVEVTSRGADIGGERLLLSIIRDITDRRQVEAARLLAEEERDAFLASVTHDLKTPLTSIQGGLQFTERLLRQRRIAGAGAVLDSLALAQRASLRMAAMISELIDLSHMQSGRALELNLEQLDVVALARRTAEELAEVDGGHAIEVVTSAPRLLCVGDRGRLERVLANLLANALKYSPTGSPITVTIRAAQGEHGSVAVVSVADRGIGIPAADLPHVFQRFYRGSNVMGRVSGSGIGLAGARQIVEAHGGTIEAASVESEGTTVTVRLPCAG